MAKKHYPATGVTPHGWYDLAKGEKPMMWLDAYDGSITFHMMGGMAVPDRVVAPEMVHLTSLKGLIPPWKHIDQKGATEDGITNIDALYDPIEVEVGVECRGRSPKWTRRVYRDLVASIDAKQESTLNFLTHDMGHWWAPVRWFQGAPQAPLEIGKRQRESLRLRADSGFWRTYDYAASFQFEYESMTDTFNYDTSGSQDLGADWPLYYEGDGGGYVYANGDQARWRDDPDDPLTTDTREVVCGPYKDFDTDTDNQVVSMVLGGFQEWSLPDSGANDLWARMGRDSNGDWDGNGIRMRVQGNWIKLSRFNNFSQTVMFQRPLLVAPLIGEKFTLVAGYEGDPRMFKVLRNGLPILSHKETGTGSELGPDYRGIGFGMQAGGALITQATPAPVRKVSAGDNANVTQSGFVSMVNVGDQPMYWDATLFGPGTFRLYDGPGADEYVEFGPLLPNQIVFLRTDPRSQTTLVQDLTSVPPSPQELNIFQQAVKSLLSFFSERNAFTDQIGSLFGIVPPQGNFYKYLSGRFSENAAIPAKSPGEPAQQFFVKTEIVGGNADSKVILSGTPLRRYPM
ncbi:minor tail protein [Mycobacterium phage OldBen]|uniref:Minor tail protein n=1 Tax=Mycobacterium phage OldBen TaxID=2079284 RepID=A0A2K9VE06_9CAUD|nr:minor tail protein [Mycobacterium phage OldBen]AUV60518.1 minor tail protein [Mycobacterium phage OldBen]